MAVAACIACDQYPMKSTTSGMENLISTYMQDKLQIKACCVAECQAKTSHCEPPYTSQGWEAMVGGWEGGGASQVPIRGTGRSGGVVGMGGGVSVEGWRVRRRWPSHGASRDPPEQAPGPIQAPKWRRPGIWRRDNFLEFSEFS